MREINMEEVKVCAFFDVLGTRDIMIGDNKSRRNALIDLVRRLAEREDSYSSNVQNLGFGIVMSPSAQSTSFSDNVAISFPLKRMNMPGTMNNQPYTFHVEAYEFFNHLLIQIVTAVWDGLKIGVLFRGGITVGRLIHDDEIIAGEALVTSVELEKATKYPRIEIASDVIDLVDDYGQPIVEDYIKNECLEQIDGKWFVRVLDFHLGYWQDHNWHRQQRGEQPEEIPIALARIRKCLDTEFERVREYGLDSAREKWEWFMPQFENAFQSNNWQLVQGAYEAACGKCRDSD